MNPFQRLIKLLGDVFIPILPAIVTAGLLLGLNNVLTAENYLVLSHLFNNMHGLLTLQISLTLSQVPHLSSCRFNWLVSYACIWW